MSSRTSEWVHSLGVVVSCVTLVLVVAVVIGVYTGNGGTSIAAAAPTLAADPAASLVLQARGRTLVIPMGYYYGTFVAHLWMRTYQRPFRMRVDTGSSVLLFGDLPGCIDGAGTVCTAGSDPTAAPIQVTFAEDAPLEVRRTTIAPQSISLGFIDGTPRVEPAALKVRVADNTRSFLLPLGFGGGSEGLMNQLGVRRLQVWLVDQTWSLSMPCQIVLSPSAPVNQSRVLIRVPLVTAADFLKTIGRSGTQETDPSYVFRIDPPPLPAAQTIRFAVIDIGSTLSYVPLAPGSDRLAADVRMTVPGTGHSITLAQQETLPLSTVAHLDGMFQHQVVVIGNRALNNLVLDVDLDEGATGTLRLINP